MTILPLAVSAHDIEVANADGVTIYYNYSDDGKELVVTNRNHYTNSYTGYVEIPEEVTYMNRTRKVTSIGESAFWDCSNLTSITIPNSVTSIGNQAFCGCSKLTSVTIPNSVTSIGDRAFENCSNLTSVTISNGVTNIGDNAFMSCSGLTSVTIPNSVTYIGDWAFYGCSGLTSVTIPNSVTSIDMYTFYGCSGLTSVEIPNSVTSIGKYAFMYCSGFTSISIPNSVKSIDDKAFCGCSNLSSVTIPNSVTSIGQSAFEECNLLSSVVSLIENPFRIEGKNTSDRTFSSDVFNNVTLYVPVGTIDKYKATEGWKDFFFIEEMAGEKEKCATPTITFKDGKLSFSCETEGVTFCYSVSSSFQGEGNEVSSLSKKNIVSVYAKKDGYENSETVTKEIELGGTLGDVNGDGVVDISDYVGVANIILTGKP